MRFFLTLFAMALFVISGIEVYGLFDQQDDLEREILKLQTQANIFDSQNSRLVKDIEYFSHEENLEKEFKSKFNYRAPGERLIILVPEEEADPVAP